MRSRDTGFDLSFDHPGESETVSASDAAQTLRLDLSGEDLQVTHIAITDGVLHLSLEATLTEKRLAHAVTLHMPTAPTPASAPPLSEEETTTPPANDTVTQTPTPQDDPHVADPAVKDTPHTHEAAEEDEDRAPAPFDASVPESEDASPLSDEVTPAPRPEPEVTQDTAPTSAPDLDAGTPADLETDAEMESPPPPEASPDPEDGDEKTFYLTEDDFETDELPDVPPSPTEEADDIDAPLARNTNAAALETLDMNPEEFLGQPDDADVEDDAAPLATEAPHAEPGTAASPTPAAQEEDAARLSAEEPTPPEEHAPAPDAASLPHPDTPATPAPSRKEVGDDIPMGQDASDLLLENDFRDPAPADPQDTHGAPEQDDIEWATSLDESSVVDDFESDAEEPTQDAPPPTPDVPTPPIERPRAPMPEEKHHTPPPPLNAVDGDDIFSKAVPKSAPKPETPKTPEPNETMTFHASSGRSGMTGTFQSKSVERMDAPKKPAAPPKPKNETSGLVKYVCPRCKTPGMAVVDKVGQIVTCDECGKALRLTLKK